MTKPEPKATIVAVMMGMGHLRAAYPLRSLSPDGLLLYGSKENTPKSEYKIWKKIRKSYYFFSRAGEIPFIGSLLLQIMVWLQRIEPYYPRKDRSGSTIAVLYLENQIRRNGLCKALVETIRVRGLPAIHTYFATAITADKTLSNENYLLICDSDFNRIWVPKHAAQSRLKFFAPCTQVKRRLMSYGVNEQNILLTGFPLPKENIGSELGLEILKHDLFNRLYRLDPSGRFFSIHKRSVMHWLDRLETPVCRDVCFTVTFAIGGAGAQTELAVTILRSLAKSIRNHRIRFILTVGIEKRIYDKVLKHVHDCGFQALPHEGVEIIFDSDPNAYLDKFNDCLRRTDVLWTKPSELVFYCGLGLPILMAPPIGTHEELNKRWLQEVHAGVAMAGPAKFCHEWLFDLRESGRLAEAAWDGFLKVRKLGTFKIERLISQGMFEEGRAPLEQ